MGRTLTILALIVTTALALWFSLERGASPEELRLEEPTSEREANEESDRSESRTLPAADSSEAEEGAPKTIGDVTEREAVITGRLLLPNGNGARDVEVSLAAFLRFEFLDPGERSRHRPVSIVATDVEGRFRIAFDPTRLQTFALECRPRSWVGHVWRWRDIAPGQRVDVGTITLERGGTIVGTVVDGVGEALTEGWTVGVRFEHEPEDRPAAWVRTLEANGTNHRFTLENVRPGACRVAAQMEGTSMRAEQDLVVTAGSSHEVELRFAEVRRTGRVRLAIHSSFRSILPEERYVTLLTASGERLPCRKVSDSSAPYVFDDVPDGEHVLTIEDPRFVPSSRPGVRASAVPLRVRVQGNSALVVRVIDDRGEPVTRFALDHAVSWKQGEFKSSMDRMKWLDEAEHADGLVTIDGLVAASFQLHARAPGLAEGKIAVPDLQPNETRPITITLGRPAALPGIVVDHEGHPVRDIEVRLHLPAERDDSSTSRYLEKNVSTSGMERMRREKERVTTDADGRFLFQDLAPGTYHLRVHHGPEDSRAVGTWTVREDVELTSGRNDEVRLVLERGCFFTGRVLMADPSHAERVRLTLAPTDDGAFEPFASATVSLDESGNFRMGPLAPGTFEVWASLEPRYDRERAPNAFHADGKVWKLDEVTLPANADLAKTLDLGDRSPGSLRVQLHVTGSDARRFGITTYPSEMERSNGDSFAVVGETLVAEIVPVFAGRKDLRVSALDETWDAVVTGALDLPPGGHAEVTLNLEVVTRELRCLDRATGRPLAGVPVALYPDPGGFLRPSRAARVETDEQGSVTLTLPAGRYVDVRSDPKNPGTYRRTHVDWLRGAGPLEVRL